MVSLVAIAAVDVINIDLCIVIGHERLLISVIVVIHVMFLCKTLFKRYQLLLHLPGDSIFAKHQQ